MNHILINGKPHDIDHYEGRFGIEDTHQAIAEANRLGIKPFCITIDQEAEEYLPYLFGRDGFTVILRPAQLPIRLPQLYHQLCLRNSYLVFIAKQKMRLIGKIVKIVECR